MDRARSSRDRRIGEASSPATRVARGAESTGRDARGPSGGAPRIGSGGAERGAGPEAHEERAGRPRGAERAPGTGAVWAQRGP